MSDNESSDGADELQALMEEYATKEEGDGVGDDDSKNVSLDFPSVPMEKIVFGDKQSLINNLSHAVQKHHKTNNNDSDKDDDDEVEQGSRKRRPAWTDADDDELQLGEVKRPTRYNGPLNHLNMEKSYKEYLTTRFTRINSQPKWAELNKDTSTEANDEDVSKDEELLQSVGFIDKRATGRTLRQQIIQHKQTKDLNRESYAEGSIASIQFHPTSTAALVAGASGVVSIYSVDGQKNEKLHNVRFKKFPIRCARIVPSGTKAFFGSNKPFYYSYDLITAQETKLKMPSSALRWFSRFEVSPCGRYIGVVGEYGFIHLLTANSNEIIHSFKQEETAASLCFTGDSSRLICNGKDSNISIFSLRQQRMEHRFIDDGCIKGNALDLAPNQRLLATGSMEGVVNVYDFDRVLLSRNPQPEKSFMNLTTAITHVRFNHTSEILAMCSGEAPGAVKLAHFPSATVFANFPQFNSKVGMIKRVEFSPMSGFMAFGTKQKRALLFRLNHFRNY